MISHLTTRLNRLERTHYPKDACTMCHDAGIWVAHYESDPEQEIHGCPECGRFNLISVVYEPVPLPIPN